MCIWLWCVVAGLRGRRERLGREWYSCVAAMSSAHQADGWGAESLRRRFASHAAARDTNREILASDAGGGALPSSGTTRTSGLLPCSAVARALETLSVSSRSGRQVLNTTGAPPSSTTMPPIRGLDPHRRAHSAAS